MTEQGLLLLAPAEEPAQAPAEKPERERRQLRRRRWTLIRTWEIRRPGEPAREFLTEAEAREAWESERTPGAQLINLNRYREPGKRKETIIDIELASRPENKPAEKGPEIEFAKNRAEGWITGTLELPDGETITATRTLENGADDIALIQDIKAELLRKGGERQR